MNWQSEIWSCYYCGSYNENSLYYCPHCNSRRREEKRLNRPAVRILPPDMLYYPKGDVSFCTPYYTADICYKGVPISQLNKRALEEAVKHIKREIGSSPWYR